MITPEHRHKRAYQRDAILAIHLHRESRMAKDAEVAQFCIKHRNEVLEAARYHKAAYDVLYAYRTGMINDQDIETIRRMAEESAS
ncbi:MAG: hypothetical protein CMF22_12075 [Idiomarinaceae bacterium]|nr:hypothetical protein [Idiomarinaceae bacterium]|tara:strand:+ start:5417 stop:5671 length:255 start_codon:yes stop_codon:yes gene_type:complete